MRLLKIIAASFAVLVLAAQTNGQPRRIQFTVPTSSGGILVESLARCSKAACPVVMILSGARGFGSPAYGEILKTFQAGGVDAYLVHFLNKSDLESIASAGSAQGRIAYYNRRLSQWVSGVQEVAGYLKRQPSHGGQLGLIGISLGAQIAITASAELGLFDALVLVDGGFPNGYSRPVRDLPPLLLIWGGSDKIFPLSTGRALQERAKRLGGPVALQVFKGGAHDFFLKSGTQNAKAAHQQSVEFFKRYLLKAH